MGHDIKKLRPDKNSRYKQGYFDVSNSVKYKGKDDNDKTVIYRSSLELKFCQLCETSPKIIMWASETLPITYELDGKTHTYWPDFLFETVHGTKFLIEVKPFCQTKTPNRYASMYDKLTFRKNMAKWNAAQQWVSQTNRALGSEIWRFKIITERFFSI